MCQRWLNIIGGHKFQNRFAYIEDEVLYRGFLQIGDFMGQIVMVENSYLAYAVCHVATIPTHYHLLIFDHYQRSDALNKHTNKQTNKQLDSSIYK